MRLALTSNHEICFLKRNHTLIRQAHTGITECRDGLEEGEPRGGDFLGLGVKNVLVSTSSHDIGGHDDESRELDKEKVLLESVLAHHFCR